MVADNGVSFDFNNLKRKVGPYDINKPVEHLPENGFRFIFNQYVNG